jgi:TolB-like protein/tetratricopeptide (TPR) repeat protein
LSRYSKVEIACDDMGLQPLKNIAEPMRAWRVRLTGQSSYAVESGSAVSQPQALPLPDKPSIAVLPFQNMSGDPEQEYFADGIVEETITALSRFRNLFVIARNSSFTYKGRAVDVKQVGRELGVRYVLEGSVRKAANRVRITGQLIEAATGTHLWADRFDGTLEDIFDLQDQVTTKVVGAIAPTLEQAEIERAKRKPTGSYDAYDYFLRGVASVHLLTNESIGEALRLLSKAVELDPQFASAYGMAAYCYDRRKADGWMMNGVAETAEAARLARRAAELGKNDAVALCFGGIALAYVVGDLVDGIAMIDRALVLNPNLAAAWNFSGWARAFFGEPELAIEHLTRAMRLSPLDPIMFNMHGGTAFAQFLAGHYEEAVVWAERALRERPNYVSAMRILTVGYAFTGRLAEARATLVRLLQLDPRLRMSTLKDLLPLRRSEDLARVADGLRMAGLPEQ